MRLAKWVRVDPYTCALLGMVALASVLPVRGAAAVQAGNTTTVALEMGLLPACSALLRPWTCREVVRPRTRQPRGLVRVERRKHLVVDAFVEARVVRDALEDDLIGASIAIAAQHGDQVRCIPNSHVVPG